MTRLFKNKMLVLATVGLVVLAQSVFWEYARVRPDYRFVISPWSVRGFQTSEGRIVAAGTLLVLALTLLIAFGVIKTTRLHSIGTAAVMVGFAAAAPVGVNARPVILSGLGVVLFSLLATTAVGIVLGRLLPGSMDSRLRALLKVGAWFFGLLFFLLVVFDPLLGGESRPAWLVMLVLFGMLAVLNVFRSPMQLGALRTIVTSTGALWAMSITMAGSVRSTLMRLQFELNEVSADRIDVQITSGIILAWLGGLLAFVGAVGLWAQRRDEIAAHDRAHRQQAAARQSEKELAEVGG